LFFAYNFPLAVVYLKEFYSNYRVWLVGLAASVFYVLFPVVPSKPSIDVGIPTVGLFHRLLEWTFSSPRTVHGVFYLCFLLALPFLFWIVRDLVQRYLKSRFDVALMLDLAIVVFFVVMPFSYLGWEKYFMPVVPPVILRVLLIGRESSTAAVR
jgi:hypothetical protein